jgi:hypothetical protein
MSLPPGIRSGRTGDLVSGVQGASPPPPVHGVQVYRVVEP